MRDGDIVLKMLGLIFGLIGTIFFVVGLFLGVQGLGFAPGKEHTTAKIVSFNPARITYKYDGKSYNEKMNYSTSSMRINDKVDIYVNPKNPKDFMISSGKLLIGGIFFGIGSVFLIIGTIFNVIWVKEVKLKKRLLREGVRIQARLDKIDWNYSTTVNGRNPLKAYCHYDDPYGKRYEFKSNNIWEDRGYQTEGELYVTVYVDKNDMTKYYVDPLTLPVIEAPVDGMQ